MKHYKEEGMFEFESDEHNSSNTKNNTALKKLLNGSTAESFNVFSNCDDSFYLTNSPFVVQNRQNTFSSYTSDSTFSIANSYSNFYTPQKFQCNSQLSFKDLFPSISSAPTWIPTPPATLSQAGFNAEPGNILNEITTIDESNEVPNLCIGTESLPVRSSTPINIPKRLNHSR